MKKQQLITLDDDLIEKYKSMNVNISGTINGLLRSNLQEVKRENLPEEVKIIRCKICSKEIDEGYYCPDKRLILCEACQENYPMRTCPYDKFGEHSHLKWPSIVLKAPNKPIEDKE